MQSLQEDYATHSRVACFRARPVSISGRRQQRPTPTMDAGRSARLAIKALIYMEVVHGLFW